MSAAAHQFASNVTAAAEAMRRARELRHENVAGDLGEQVQVLARAVVAQGEEIIALKGVISALAREAQKA